MFRMLPFQWSLDGMYIESQASLNETLIQKTFCISPQNVCVALYLGAWYYIVKHLT